MDDRNIKIWMKLMEYGSKYWGCHQMPERSFFIKGFQFPVCARCTGILAGYILAAICRGFRIRVGYRKSCFMLIPMAVDGGLQYLTGYHSNNRRRFWTGLLAGFGFIQLILSAFCYFISKIKRGC